VDEAMSIFLSTGVSDAAAATVTLGLQHEQQHQELLVTDTLYLFSCHPLLPVWDESMTLQKYRQSAEYRWLSLPEGVHTIGYEGDGFCFDNELGVHKQYIPAGEIMSRPVTNGEFLEFIEDGGYKNFRYWLSEGWDWVNREKIEHPLYWQKKEQDWYFYHIDGLKKLDADLPLMHVSYYEAEAFAHWKKMRLPTEFEWETAAKLYPESFRPVVWEWTQSAYLPYPGFKTAEGAIGEYNGKFMVSQMVLRGGSIATPAGHTRFTYRNFFHPHFQWQFSGIRLMK
jgi:ergothioneine biosynthesis protein EgtB